MSPAKVFISYSHKDEYWLGRVKAHLKPLVDQKKIEIWDDTEIKAGEDWLDKIRVALKESDAAILLLSADFWASDFINVEELPPLLDSARKEGVHIFPLYLKASHWNTRLNRFQGVNDPQITLDQKKASEREQVLADLVKRIENLLGNLNLTEIKEDEVQEIEILLQRLEKRRRNAFKLLVIGSLIILIIALVHYRLGPLISKIFIKKDKVTLLIKNSLWISINPMRSDAQNFWPPVESLDQQLEWIQQAGFTGVITFSSQGTFSEIPRLAKEKDLNVIMGVWNPKDEQEVDAAVAQKRFVDAYSVGHNHNDTDLYTFKDLLSATRYIRWRTCRPVSTTEQLSDYSDRRLLQLGDWMFPDVEISLRGTSGRENDFVGDADRHAREIIRMADSLSHSPASENGPILLKIVRYPMDENALEGTSPEEQALFFELILEARRDARFPRNIFIAFDGAFDTLWKGDDPTTYYPWEVSTGLLNPDGSPRPAAVKIKERWTP